MINQINGNKIISRAKKKSANNIVSIDNLEEFLKYLHTIPKNNDVKMEAIIKEKDVEYFKKTEPLFWKERDTTRYANKITLSAVAILPAYEAVTIAKKYLGKFEPQIIQGAFIKKDLWKSTKNIFVGTMQQDNALAFAWNFYAKYFTRKKSKTQ